MAAVRSPAAGGALRPGWLLALVVVLAALAYLNTLHAPLVFDDLAGITRNPTLRHLGDVRQVLSPPGDGSGVTGRPLVNLSLAVNYAMGGLAVESYHATNLLIHAAATAALFGLLLSTLRHERMPAVPRCHAPALAALLAAAWALHPLQTESVTCVIQRTESLMGALWLAAFYTFVRSLASPRPGWRLATVALCAAGMATKEVMVSAPLLMLLYDRTFVAGTLAAAWRQRRGFYLSLAATWLILAWLVIGQHGSRGNAEGATVLPTIFVYAATQSIALVRYLALSFWPQPLVLDYGTALATNVAVCLLPAALVIALAWLAAREVIRGSAAGFLAAWFFVILAPSTSVIPLLPQPVAEHRMYLPVLTPLALLALGCGISLGRRAALPLVLGIAAFAALTLHRNTQYRSVASIWRDTLAKVPRNPRAYYNLGCEIAAADPQGAIAAYRHAIDLDPGYADAHNNLGQTLGRLGQVSEAMVQLRIATRIKPDLVDAWANLGIQTLQFGRPREAVALLENVVKIRPDDSQAHGWLGNAWIQLQQWSAAQTEYETALRLRPDYPEAESNLGAIELLQGHVDAGIAHLRRAIALNPQMIDAHQNLARALQAQGNAAAAEAELQTVARLRAGH